MLSPAIRRAIPPACATCSSSTQAVSRPTVLASITATSQNLNRRPLHQRRHSSSKASSPPDEDAKVVPTPPRETAKDSDTPKATVKKTASRAGRKKAVAPSVNVPKVPPTTHLNPRDVHTSSWFAMHRPISVTTPWPPNATPETFNSIFDVKVNQYADSIHTISDAVESLEAAGQFQIREDTESRDNMFQNASFGGAMGGPATTAEVDQLLAQCVPFRPPPPPVALAEVTQKRKTTTRKNARENNAASEPKHKSWNVNVNVTESTYSNGLRTLTFETSEPQEVDAQEISTTAEPVEARVTPHRQPFLHRMHSRRIKWLQNPQNSKVRKMHLISVKRQRKLKMKKHKYKKLMKRTRALRRKLDR